ncbi:DUF4870 domain-containing protein [Rarobacter incanus]|uniref:DUF4870 domain-containing protein n=1 Tax=Rarobacter incanus TaxID=153494 RepID=A0A542SPL0_9MICO|nr:DUF4870 domain-containing protein [Rarobacter incanus]TQK76563.1 hypothetical protein FB389_1246 [Rarobacter incanus]
MTYQPAETPEPTPQDPAAPQQPFQQPGYQAPQQPYQQPGHQAPQQPYQQPYQQPGHQAPQQPYQQPGYGAPQAAGSADLGQAALTHLLGGILLWLGALIGWLISKDKSEFNNEEGKKALNFQIVVSAAIIVLSIVQGVVAGAATTATLNSIYATGSAASGGFLSLLSGLIGLVILATWVISLILGIKNYSAVKAGQPSSYPIKFALIK